jgi:hypothetical protein
LSDRKAVVQVGDTVYSETFNLEVGWLCARKSVYLSGAMSVSSQLVNHNSAAIQQDQIFSLVLGPGVRFLKQQAGTGGKKTKSC